MTVEEARGLSGDPGVPLTMVDMSVQEADDARAELAGAVDQARSALSIARREARETGSSPEETERLAASGSASLAAPPEDATSLPSPPAEPVEMAPRLEEEQPEGEEPLELALAGHSSGAVDHETAVNTIGFHLLGAAVWVGGLMALAVIRPMVGKDLPVAVRRYSVVAGWCFLTVLLSGAVNGWVRLGSLAGFSTTYGAVLLTKVVALGLLASARVGALLPGDADVSLDTRFIDAYINDDRALIERFLERPRHIEIQIFADHQGNGSGRCVVAEPVHIADEEPGEIPERPARKHIRPASARKHRAKFGECASAEQGVDAAENPDGENPVHAR